MFFLFFFFFFQAEDGIRDGHVTGVQTCALPIFPTAANGRPAGHPSAPSATPTCTTTRTTTPRSEERRVGKECGGRRRADGDNQSVPRWRADSRSVRGVLRRAADVHLDAHRRPAA